MMLPQSARRVFAAIERAIVSGVSSSPSVSYTSFGLDHHIARKAVSPDERPRVMQRRVPSLPLLVFCDDGEMADEGQDCPAAKPAEVTAGHASHTRRRCKVLI
jgi:hypothetical protein